MKRRKIVIKNRLKTMQIKEEKELLRALMLDKENSILLTDISNKYGVNYITKDGRTILNYSIILKSVFLSTLLLSNKECNINFQEEESGFSPLHFAVQEKLIPAIELLLKRDDLEVDLRDSYGHTPLLRILTNGSRKDPISYIMVEKLIKKGASIDIENSSGQSPRSMMQEITKEKIIDSNGNLVDYSKFLK